MKVYDTAARPLQNAHQAGLETTAPQRVSTDTKGSYLQQETARQGFLRANPSCT